MKQHLKTLKTKLVKELIEGVWVGILWIFKEFRKFSMLK